MMRGGDPPALYLYSHLGTGPSWAVTNPVGKLPGIGAAAQPA